MPTLFWKSWLTSQRSARVAAAVRFAENWANLKVTSKPYMVYTWHCGCKRIVSCQCWNQNGLQRIFRWQWALKPRLLSKLLSVGKVRYQPAVIFQQLTQFVIRESRFHQQPTRVQIKPLNVTEYLWNPSCAKKAFPTSRFKGDRSSRWHYGYQHSKTSWMRTTSTRIGQNNRVPVLRRVRCGRSWRSSYRFVKRT